MSQARLEIKDCEKDKLIITVHSKISELELQQVAEKIINSNSSEICFKHCEFNKKIAHFLFSVAIQNPRLRTWEIDSCNFLIQKTLLRDLVYCSDELINAINRNKNLLVLKMKSRKKSWFSLSEDITGLNPKSADIQNAHLQEIHFDGSMAIINFINRDLELDAIIFKNLAFRGYEFLHYLPRTIKHLKFNNVSFETDWRYFQNEQEEMWNKTFSDFISGCSQLRILEIDKFNMKDEERDRNYRWRINEYSRTWSGMFLDRLSEVVTHHPSLEFFALNSQDPIMRFVIDDRFSAFQSNVKLIENQEAKLMHCVQEVSAGIFHINGLLRLILSYADTSNNLFINKIDPAILEYYRKPSPPLFFPAVTSPKDEKKAAPKAVRIKKTSI